MTFPTVALGLDGWTLRAWRAADAESLSLHAGNERVWRWMSDRFPHPYTLEIARHWVERGHVDFGGDNCAIALDDVAVGGCGLAQGQGQFACNVEIGYWLGEPWWGRGVVTRVVGELTRIAFESAGVTRVHAPVHDGNLASMRVLEKNGYAREGVQRWSALKAGRVIHRVVYATYRAPADGAAA